MKFIIGKKVEMSQIFLADGTVVQVTRISAGPCFVTAKKSKAADGYGAVQIAYVEKKKMNKPLAGLFKKIFKKENFGYRFLKEFRLDEKDPSYAQLEPGQKLDVSIFKPGDVVNVQGTSKGRGFQGVVKRHGFKGGKKSHGHKDQLRMPGSIGAKGPAHVFKGMRMGGHMGNDLVTVKNLEVVSVDPVKNEISLKGAVPGARHGVLYLIAEGALEMPRVEQPAEKVEVKAEEKK